MTRFADRSVTFATTRFDPADQTVEMGASPQS
jgi:hypothetical protein